MSPFQLSPRRGSGGAWSTIQSTVRRRGWSLQRAQDQRGWVALVVFVLERAGGDVTVQEWVPADRLRPASR